MAAELVHVLSQSGPPAVQAAQLRDSAGNPNHLQL